jgi:hypothetical protein
MSTPSSSEKSQFRILPPAILFLSVIFLFVAPKLWLEDSNNPSTSLTNWIEVMHDTSVTGPQGNTVSFSEAVKNGWVGLNATRFRSYKMSYPSKVTMAYKLSNKTTMPIHIRMPADIKGNAARPTTLDIPPGDTRQVETTTASTPINFKTIMPVVVSLAFLLAGLFVILSKRYQPSERHWAYGAVGTIAGYWLKG